MTFETPLIALSFIERMVLGDIQGARDLASVTGDVDQGALVSVLATLTATVLVNEYGLTGAIERIDGLRKAALAGAADGARDA
jgi:hypothetical protein